METSESGFRSKLQLSSLLWCAVHRVDPKSICRGAGAGHVSLLSISERWLDLFGHTLRACQQRAASIQNVKIEIR